VVRPNKLRRAAYQEPPFHAPARQWDDPASEVGNISQAETVYKEVNCERRTKGVVRSRHRRSGKPGRVDRGRYQLVQLPESRL